MRLEHESVKERLVFSIQVCQKRFGSRPGTCTCLEYLCILITTFKHIKFTTYGKNEILVIKKSPPYFHIGNRILTLIEM